MKTFQIILGFVFLALAVIGAILPVMPTTCFVLGAAACFAKSSPRFHQWLLDSRIFGPMIKNWQATRSMPRRAKIIAIASLICSGAISVSMLDSTALQLTVVGLLVIPVVIILRIRTSEDLVLTRESD